LVDPAIISRAGKFPIELTQNHRSFPIGKLGEARTFANDSIRLRSEEEIEALTPVPDGDNAPTQDIGTLPQNRPSRAASILELQGNSLADTQGDESPLNGHVPSAENLKAKTESTSLDGWRRVIARGVLPDPIDPVACGQFGPEDAVTLTLSFSAAMEAIDAPDITLVFESDL
jgi:hypothetical protein